MTRKANDGLTIGRYLDPRALDIGVQLEFERYQERSRGVIHERPVGATVEWYTPHSLFGRLGAEFDLDPAGSFDAEVPAHAIWTKEDDGLAHRWAGHVWLNPPYGPAGVAFIDRMIAHADGLMLLPSRTETAVYQRALTAADSVCFLRDRLWFVRNDGVTGRSSFGSTLFAFGDWAAEILLRADLGHTVSAYLAGVGA